MGEIVDFENTFVLCGEIYGNPIAWIKHRQPAAPTGGADAHESLRKALRHAGGTYSRQRGRIRSLAQK